MIHPAPAFVSRVVILLAALAGTTVAADPDMAWAAARRAVHHAAAPDPGPQPAPAVAWVELKTELGSIVVELDGAHAPISVSNFLHYVDSRHYDGLLFYRAMHLDWGTQPNGVLQGGVRDGAKLFKPVAHEPTSLTGIHHVAGTLSMARLAPGTATSDFSILLSDLPSFDADPAASDPERQAGYAAFGHVVAGIDVVRRIWDLPRSQTLGDGAMKGQMLESPVKVVSARRVAGPPGPAANPTAGSPPPPTLPPALGPASNPGPASAH